MPIDPRNTAEINQVQAERSQPDSTEPNKPDHEVPEELLRAMRLAVPSQYWEETACRLKRGFNLRMARSKDLAEVWTARETAAYNAHALELRKARLTASIGKAATAVATVAAYILSKSPWRD